ncbi:uncharacterized protein BCR38DRAFT_508492 [Pseudomassariella vexata]|uniref:Gylcosyl hydrolase 115 C-terminal domain-containing protein n=1 Tax=Pseudomassariella vexata TaxID=1141098 RepID=A0A1Y2ECR6_9PEZI|nr:uncharacterized protein BCR38DRAFT_508492 [Pseudomassariella vexata]ORY69046.1 hypothetical protein BCR38DRAFT_508492 [Pseudomassariella vexata]
MFRPPLVAFATSSTDQNSEDLVDLVGATILVDPSDSAEVRIAAQTLSHDFGRVTKSTPSPLISIGPQHGDIDIEGDTAIIIGCIKSSALIQRLLRDGQLDVEGVRGKWESFSTAIVERPAGISACRKALVIAGSDKRGTIFGTYTLSEQIGVSPWYWWADVPPKFHPKIYALPITTSSQEPSVKFRGIFINDEAPALTGFVIEKFGKYGTEFYKRVFELLLRLKANFLWPAMWPGYPNPGSSFFVDDNENQKIADQYGIVMSTSHHEPTQRATNEWFETNPDGSWSWLENKQKITQFFDEGLKRAEGFESYFTMGMRGEYDKSMKTDDPAAVVRDVIRTQRSLINKLHGCEDAVPQLLALYKEVQGYWDSGNLDVPDDVTLLFADDNFGTIRRLPTGNEVNRKGGSGIYYHFEYVGTPRSYKWINSNSLGKTWHQLQEAHRRNAKQVWVFDVGDIKPMEIPLSFAMTLAWDINSISSNSLPDFFHSLAEREFNSEIAPAIASAWHEYDCLVSLRRHEHIESNTFSLLHYSEADAIVNHWQDLLTTVETLYNSSKFLEEYKPAFFQLVLHPIKASTIYLSLRIHQSRNQLWALQRRNSTNNAARTVLDLFDADFKLSEEFHSLLDGKWNHIMRQPHYGYGDTWHAPSRDMISGLCFVQRGQDSNPVVGQMGVMVEGHAGVRPGVCNEESDRTHPSIRDLVPGVTLGEMTPYGPEGRWFELYTRGTVTLDWESSVLVDWIWLSESKGRLVPGKADVRVWLTVDWSSVPDGFDEEVLIDVRTKGGNYGPYGDDFEQIHLPIRHRRITQPFVGFVESDGHVSIPATSIEAPPAYRKLPDVGRHSGAIGLKPQVESETTLDPIPFLSYPFYIFDGHGEVSLGLYFNMTLDIDPEDPMEYDVQINDMAVQTHRLVSKAEVEGELKPGWYHAVQDCVWKRWHDIGRLKAGPHDVRIRLRHSNVLLEKLVLDLGGVKESYLGPPPSLQIT